MTFELLPTVTPWLVGFFAIAALGVALAVGVVATEVATHRRDRLAKRQTMRAYWTPRLALHH